MRKVPGTGQILVSTPAASNSPADQSERTALAAEKTRRLPLRQFEDRIWTDTEKKPPEKLVISRLRVLTQTSAPATKRKNLTVHVVASISRKRRKDMFNKMFRVMAAAFAVICTVLSGMTVYASPVRMLDGQLFDAEYYAEQNPDVAAAVGTDFNALYQHYLTNGKAEGRRPYDESLEPNVSHTQTQYSRRIIELVNQARKDAGVDPLTDNATLDADAAQRAYEVNQTHAHTRLDGSAWYTLDPDHMYGENLACTYSDSSPEHVFAMWMNSAGHRANILDPDFRSIGVGYFINSMGGYTVIQNFGYFN